jgi:hypothetical protein
MLNARTWVSRDVLRQFVDASAALQAGRGSQVRGRTRSASASLALAGGKTRHVRPDTGSGCRGHEPGHDGENLCTSCANLLCSLLCGLIAARFLSPFE